jgi:hypothetical protein
VRALVRSDAPQACAIASHCRAAQMPTGCDEPGCPTPIQCAGVIAGWNGNTCEVGVRVVWCVVAVIARTHSNTRSTRRPSASRRAAVPTSTTPPTVTTPHRYREREIAQRMLKCACVRAGSRGVGDVRLGRVPQRVSTGRARVGVRHAHAHRVGVCDRTRCAGTTQSRRSATRQDVRWVLT